MYIKPESPAEVFVKHFITKTRGSENDKCVPKESVIGSGIKGLQCVSDGKRAGDRQREEEREAGGGEGRVEGGQQTNVGLPRQGDRVAEWVGLDRHISHRLTAPSIAPGWPP